MSHEYWVRWVTGGRLFSLGFLGLFGSQRCDSPQPLPDGGAPISSESPTSSESPGGSEVNHSSGAPNDSDASPSAVTSETMDTATTAETLSASYPDGGETFDGGANTSQEVDGGAPLCSGVCPLRVDTHAAVAGDGGSWSSPMNDLQLAIDRQFEAGGGEVWVRGGLVDSTRFTDGALHLATHVAVLGGFAGFEADASERRPGSEPTVLPDSWGDGAEIPLFIADADHVTLDGFMLGSGSLVIERATDVLLTHVEFMRAYPMLSVSNSSVRVEDSRVDDASGYWDADLVIDQSNVAFVDTLLTFYSDGDALVTHSKVTLERCSAELEWVLDDTSQLLAVDTRLRESFLSNGVITGGDVALVGSHVTGGGWGRPAIAVQRVLAYNTSFVSVGTGTRRSSMPRAITLYGSKSVEVSFCTFFRNSCSTYEDGPPCYADIYAADQINNSLFVPRLRDDPTVPPQFYAVRGRFASSNCATYDATLFTADRRTGDAFADLHPCPDIGDAHEGAASLVRLRRFTPPFLTAPFYVDLSRYDSPEWWRYSSASSTTCTDEGPPDPGQHLEVPCEPAGVSP